LLAAGRRARFVGRRHEIDLFRSRILPIGSPLAVLHLYGPGGIGKTALLAEYAQIAIDAGVPAVRLDGRDIDPSPPGFLCALGEAVGLADSASPLEALSQHPRQVLLIDTYEALTPLDTWLRESLLPQLPLQTRVVIAGRECPVAAWRTDPGWSSLTRVISLRNLPPVDSRTFLHARGIPEAQHPALLSFTHGHPLALALVADLSAHGDQAAFSPEHAPDVVRALLERFVEQVPDDDYRQALQVCARTRVTTEALLRNVLETDDAAAPFNWLRGQSFIEQGPEGIFPHDLAREVLDVDLCWRDPETFRELHGRVLRYLLTQLQAGGGWAQQRAYFDIVYLSRNNPLMQPYYDWAAMSSAYAEPATPDEFPAILAMVKHHEGDASERIAAYWLARRPGAFLAFRDGGRRLAGFTAVLLLETADSEDCAADPAVSSIWRFVQRHGPLRSGERLMLHRFVVGREIHQDLATMTLVAAVGSIRWLTTPGLAWSFPVLANPDTRAQHFAAVGFMRAAEADFEVGGRRYGVFAHDWRVEPPLAWLQRKGQLDPAVEPSTTSLDSRSQSALVVLSRPDFEAAVRQALRDFTRPAALATNALLRSRVAAEHAGGTPTTATLPALLREAAETLRTSPKDEKLYRAIHRTYLAPAATQDLAAELLGLPFSTYRYHLSGGIARVVEWLWQRELDGPEG